jgi:hypothetical protein
VGGRQGLRPRFNCAYAAYPRISHAVPERVFYPCSTNIYIHLAKFRSHRASPHPLITNTKHSPIQSSQLQVRASYCVNYFPLILSSSVSAPWRPTPKGTDPYRT